ncbi:unnamed protein product, partial [Discosporangium mesarthrocarpum]
RGNGLRAGGRPWADDEARGQWHGGVRVDLGVEAVGEAGEGRGIKVTHVRVRMKGGGASSTGGRHGLRQVVARRPDPGAEFLDTRKLLGEVQAWLSRVCCDHPSLRPVALPALFRLACATGLLTRLLSALEVLRTCCLSEEVSRSTLAPVALSPAPSSALGSALGSDLGHQHQVQDPIMGLDAPLLPEAVPLAESLLSCIEGEEKAAWACLAERRGVER